MEIYHVQAFEAVVAQGSFTRAAEELHVTQPAITRQIAALEAELGVRLFDRLGRTVELTVAGRAFHGYAEQILRLAAEARQVVTEIGTGAAGRLAVGASSTLATYVLPPLLRSYREAYPRVDMAVHTGVSARVLEMVRGNEVDVGLVTEAPRDAALESVRLMGYETCVVAPPGHRLADRAAVSVADLAGSALILMESGTNLRTYVDRLLSAAGVEEQVAMELDNVEAIKRMIEAGLGISMLPEVSVRTEVEAGRLVALHLKGVTRATRQILMVHRRDRYQSAALRSFMALLRDSAGAGPGEE